MSIKLLALDIDGTLLNDDKIITDKVKRAIIEVQQQGIKVAISSGRAIFGVMPIANELELEKYGGYVLSFNGGKIVNCMTGEVMYERHLPYEVISEICTHAKANNVELITFDKDLIVENADDKYVQAEVALIKRQPKIVEDIASYVTALVNKMLMVGEPTVIERLEGEMQEVFKNRLSVYRSEPFFLEFLPLNIDKAASLARLIEFLEIDRSELMAIGDGYNDLSMIEYAGVGIAMGNARQVVQKAADYVTLSNEEDGVAHALKKWLL